MFYRSNVLIGSATDGSADLLDGYIVHVYKAGAIVQGSSSGTTVAVHKGHGFDVGDKCTLVSAAQTAFVTVSAIDTSPASYDSLTVSSSLSVVAGDILFNLGIDTGSNVPNYNGSAISVYAQPSTELTPNPNSMVVTNLAGSYEYYHTGQQAIWELVRTPEGIVATAIIDAYTPSQLTTGDASTWAVGGSGSATDPWYGWDQIFLSHTSVYFPLGYYKVTSQITISNVGVLIYGDGPSNSVILCESTDGAFKVDVSGTLANFTMRDIGLKQQSSALSSGAALLNIDECNRFHLSNLWVTAANDADYISAGTGIIAKDVNAGYIADCRVVGHDSPGGLFAIGYDLCPSVSDNRGNITIVGGFAERCTKGVRIADSASNLVNNIQIYGLKIVRSGSAATIIGVGIEANSQLDGFVFSGVHVERHLVGISLNAVRCGQVVGCILNTFGSNGPLYPADYTTGIGIEIKTGCKGISISGCRFSNDTTAARGTAVSLDASVNSAISYHNGFIDNDKVAARVVNSSTSELSNFIIDDGDSNGRIRARDQYFTVGRGAAENNGIQFHSSGGYSVLGWVNSASRVECTAALHTTLGLSHEGILDHGSVDTFADQDATPAVNAGCIFKTANTQATTITGFDNGVTGQRIVVLVQDAFTTFDFTGTTPTVILRGNSGADWAAASGDWLEAIFDGTYWYCSVHDCTAP